MSQADDALVHHESIFEKPPLSLRNVHIMYQSRKGAVNAVRGSIWTCGRGESISDRRKRVG